MYKNFVIIQVGIVDSGAFKGVEEIDKLKIKVKEDVNKYVNYIRSTGSFAEGVALTGVDPVSEVSGAAPEILRKYPGAIFFGGQLVFPEEVFMARWLHNYTVFAIQRKFYYMGIPMIMMPVRL